MAKDNDLISTLYHHGKNGPEKCPARIQCRLTNADGSPQVHYVTAEESAAAWENLLDKEYQPMVSFNKKAADALKRTEIPARYLRAGMNIGNGVIVSAYSGPRTPKGKIDVEYITEDGIRKTGQWNRATLIQVFEPIREE